MSKCLFPINLISLGYYYASVTLLESVNPKPELQVMTGDAFWEGWGDWTREKREVVCLERVEGSRVLPGVALSGVATCSVSSTLTGHHRRITSRRDKGIVNIRGFCLLYLGKLVMCE